MKEDLFRRILSTLKLDINLVRASEESLSRLAQSARLEDYDRGAYIFHAGDPSDEVHLLEHGQVILSKTGPSGKVFTYLIAVRGSILHAVTCFMSRKRFFSARVSEKACVVIIPKDTFKQWVLSDPVVAAGVLDTMADFLDGAYTRILDLIDESAENRILNALNMLCTRIGPDLRLTNADVAEMTGVTRETAARVIAHLQRIGLVEKSRRTIKVLDPDQLTTLSTSPFFVL